MTFNFPKAHSSGQSFETITLKKARLCKTCCIGTYTFSYNAYSSLEIKLSRREGMGNGSPSYAGVQKVHSSRGLPGHFRTPLAIRRSGFTGAPWDIPVPSLPGSSRWPYLPGLIHAWPKASGAVSAGVAENPSAAGSLFVGGPGMHLTSLRERWTRLTAAPLPQAAQNVGYLLLCFAPSPSLFHPRPRESVGFRKPR